MRSEYFISANTGEGFYSLYDRVFQNKDFDKIFVIHGGPGTGKSTLMRKVARAAAVAGADIEEILCSSDPSSLDGLILQKGGRRVGVLDGTPPHPRVITEPGVRETLWNLSGFWSSEKLEKARERIYAEGRKKKEAYHRAYAMLKGALSCHTETQSTLASLFLHEKAKAQIRRMTDRLKRKGEVRQRILRAYSMQGEHLCAHACESIKNQVLLCGKKHAAELYLSHLNDCLSQKGIEYTVFLSPLSPALIDAVYVPETETLFIHEKDAGKTASEKHIRMQRFLSREREAGLSRLTKLEEAMTAEALCALKVAGEAHFALEEIYKSAMRFEALREASEEWIEDALAYLR